MALRTWVGVKITVSTTMLMVGIGLLPGCDESALPPPAPARVAKAVPENKAHLNDRIVSFCGGCHGYPTADSFPKRNWEAEVRRGFDFYRNSDRNLDPPPVPDVISYYEAAAPDRLPILARRPDGPGPVRSLVRGEIAGPRPNEATAISHVALVHLTDPNLPDLLACDMASGELLIRKAGLPGEPATVLASDLAHPAHAEVADLDQDGIIDILVADLGVPIPSDDRLGRVIWLKGRKDGAYETRILLSRVGRACDVQPADFDGDGDLDLVVGVFGWHVAGEILLLEQRRASDGSVGFVRRTLDARYGTIHVPVVDLNRDGRPRRRPGNARPPYPFWAESFALTHWLRGRPPAPRLSIRRAVTVAAGTDHFPFRPEQERARGLLPGSTPAGVGSETIRDRIVTGSASTASMVENPLQTASGPKSDEESPIGATGFEADLSALASDEGELGLLQFLKSLGATVTRLPARRKALQTVFEQGKFDLLHLASHSTFGGTSSGDASAVLLDDGVFTAAQRSPMMAGPLCRCSSLVFFNTCHSGRLGFCPTRLGAWGARLVELGCGGFIGALWPVTDRAAVAFACAFYERIAERRPIGEAIQLSRQQVRKQFPNDPTWLAYCCFADPMAQIEPPRR
jgi:CHAT domain/FG-GAP-like repeat